MSHTRSERRVVSAGLLARVACTLLLALLAVPPVAAADLDARAQALRAELAGNAANTPSSQVALMQRQLLASLDRRRDLQRVRADLQAAAARNVAAAAAPAPTTLLERDDLRREVQQLDAAIEADTRRAELLHADRAAAAVWLTQTMANLRRASDAAGTHPVDAQARLEVEFAESSTAELDLMIGVVELQSQATHAQREALVRRLSAAAANLQPSDADVAEIERRLAERTDELQRRLADAIAARDRAQQARDAGAAGADPQHATTLAEQLNTRDIEVQLVREAQTNHNTEQVAWQIVLRFWRGHDASALAEARERGPSVRAAIERRLGVMTASSALMLAKLDEITMRLTRTPNAPEAAEWRAQQATFEERLRVIQDGVLDQHRALAFLDRIREDFDTRVSTMTFVERLAVGWATATGWLGRMWNFELFTIEQTVEVDGRQTAVPHGVTVAKLIEAPLLLLFGLFVTFRITAIMERIARRRGVDEIRARLTRRWVLGLLACACALSSLALAGIPLAAFAFLGGAVAIGVGFGMQTLFKNLISGVLLLIERPFRLGDEIQIGELRGTVVGIDLRASVVRDSDGGETLVPNSALIEQNLRNVTSRQKAVRHSLTIIVDAQSDPREVSEAMRDAAQRHGQLIEGREPHVLLEEFGVDGLRFRLHYWTEPMSNADRQRVASDLRQMILTGFRAAGVRLVEHAPPTVLVGAAAGAAAAVA